MVGVAGVEDSADVLRRDVDVEVEGVEVVEARGRVETVEEETFGRGGAEGSAGGRELDACDADFGADGA